MEVERSVPIVCTYCGSPLTIVLATKAPSPTMQAWKCPSCQKHQSAMFEAPIRWVGQRMSLPK